MIDIGLFDIMQIDPTDGADHAAVYRRRLDQLAHADDLGFSIAFTAERHYMAHYRCPAPGAWLGAASQRTSRMRLGVLAYTLPLHSPVRLAEEIAVLDQLTGGRLEVGVGLGHRVDELIANGVDPGQRIPIFQERLAILEGLLSGGRVSIASEHNVIREVAINPLPVQTPHPPLWYAGVDRGAAAWAGNHGLSLAVGFAPIRELAPATAGFRAGRTAREAADRESVPPGAGNAGRIALMQHVYLAESVARARAEMTDDLDRLAALDPANAGQSRTERRAQAERELDRLLAKEVFLAGVPESVAQGIGLARQALGIDLFLANVHAAGVDDERVRRTMGLLATEVRAALAAEPAGAPSSASDGAR
jgi:alkanesulfonate monooxygenase SsuD/methylene tetrahydromethanopterin reductase-like flavin-dependent oxidoreductase (luciferase family)